MRPGGQTLRKLLLVSGVALLTMPSAAAADPSPVVSPVSPEDSLKHFVIAAGLKVELAANEPQVCDPVAIRFDENGRMWVVEMRDYPTASTAGRSRISVLEDRNNDGFFETASVFADNLSFATGIQPWRGGVFATLSGQLAYLPDTDGNLRSNRIESWFTGFAEENTQLRANHPRLSLDGYIYIANGLRGGSINDVRNPDRKPVSIRGMDFRFHPTTRAAEAVSGLAQFGLTFDDYGNRFLCTNRNPAIHVVLENHHLRKNPLVAIPQVTHDVAKAGDQSRVYPITRAWTTSNLHAGQFTAACGLVVYRGDALPGDFYGNTFVCEPTGHLVRREIMRPQGVTFTSAPATEGAEFFASRDQWCCPVNLEVGPDGALYVVDMYRAIIEHPDFMPTELRGRKNLLDGNDRGRIYRVVPAMGFHRATPPRFSEMTGEELVGLLAHRNAWWRESAARLLLERHDRSIEWKLREMAQHHEWHVARCHALRLLQTFDLLSDHVLAGALRDSHPRVVEQAIIAAESRLADSNEMQQEFDKLVTHEDARVRFQALLAANSLPSVPTRPADEWELRAILLAAGDRAGSVLKTMLTHRDALEANVEKPKRFITRLAALAAASPDRQQHAIAMNALLASGPYCQPGLASFLSELLDGDRSFGHIESLLDNRARKEFDAILATAQKTAMDQRQADSIRSVAIDLLAAAGNDHETLAAFALHEPRQPVRLRAITGLAKTTQLEPWRRLLRNFAKETPALQREILAGVWKRRERILLLLDEIEAARISPAQLDLVHTNMLAEHRDPDIQARAKKLLKHAVPADREKVLADYQVALKMKADAESGRRVFKEHCATCHRIGSLGTAFAPDISDSREKSPEQLLTDILQPNRAVDSNYFSYTVVTVAGTVHTGVLAAETSTSITLKQEEGKSISLRRDEIDEIFSNGVSLMPDGIEREIATQAMADLIAFIKNWRYLEDPHVFSTR